MSMAPAPESRDVNWLLSNFVATTSAVTQAIAVSSDGLLMAMSSNLDRASADRLSAIVAGLRSLADGAARVMGAGGVAQVIVEMHDAYLFVASISDGSALGVVTAKDANLGLVGYEMTVLVERIGVHLTPELVAELKASLQT
jgi:predicted regulator of Ras-like GTPase activity (Roadblock/LC7/MglB family)